MRWVLAACTLCALAMPSGAAIYLVHPDGTGDFPTIQAAIDASAGGDVIELADGTFTGPGNRDIDYHGKAITVRSQSVNPAFCIIDCEGSESEPHRGFYFHTGEGAGSVLEAVTVTGGYATFPSPYGGGVRCDVSSPTFRNCLFTANYARAEGGGFESGGGSPTLIRCAFTATEAFSQGGGASFAGDSPTVIACSFTDNFCNGVGGGLACLGGHAQVAACVFDDNEAYEGDGLGCWGGATTAADCQFLGNRAQMSGGAVMCRGGSQTFDACTF
jgi:hypothetical protein